MNELTQWQYAKMHKCNQNGSRNAYLRGAHEQSVIRRASEISTALRKHRIKRMNSFFRNSSTWGIEKLQQFYLQNMREEGCERGREGQGKGGRRGVCVVVVGGEGTATEPSFLPVGVRSSKPTHTPGLKSVLP